ncbi:MAG: phosphatidylinositol-specific phospholipase C domain-containing protein [Oleispira sp.]
MTLLKSLAGVGLLALASAQASALEQSVEQDKVCFYHGDSFKGTSECYAPGQNISDVGNTHHNNFTSVRVYGNAYVRAYQDKNYGGKQTIIMLDAHKFDALNDEIDSLKVLIRETDDFACLYEHQGYRGTPICIESGQQISNLDGSIGRNNASSVITVGDAYVDVYEDKSFEKVKWRYNHSQGQMTGDANDNADSIKVHTGNRSDYVNRMLEQRKLTDQVAAQRGYIMGTHNSYNSWDYRNSLSLVGPNHDITLYEQLQMGSRMVELDLHNKGDELVACHAVDCDLSWTRVDIPRLISEIHNYLKGNTDDDFIFLYIENELENLDNYNFLAKLIADGLGDYVYRPENASSTSCQNVPYGKTYDEMQANGQRVLIMGAGCSSDSKASGLNLWAFANVHNSAGISNNLDFDSILQDSFKRIYECGHPSCPLDPERIFNDRDSIVRIAEGDEIPQLMQAGANVLGMDSIDWDDIESGGRFESQIWSWRAGEIGKAGWNHNVAIMSRTTPALEPQFIAGSSRSTLAFACLMATGYWQVTETLGTFSEGTEICGDIGGTFDVPLTPREARLLRNVLPETTDVFLNYGTSGGQRKLAAINALSDRKEIPQR